MSQSTETSLFCSLFLLLFGMGAPSVAQTTSGDCSPIVAGSNDIQVNVTCLDGDEALRDPRQRELNLRTLEIIGSFGDRVSLEQVLGPPQSVRDFRTPRYLADLHIIGYAFQNATLYLTAERADGQFAFTSFAIESDRPLSLSNISLAEALRALGNTDWTPPHLIQPTARGTVLSFGSSTANDLLTIGGCRVVEIYGDHVHRNVPPMIAFNHCNEGEAFGNIGYSYVTECFDCTDFATNTARQDGLSSYLDFYLVSYCQYGFPMMSCRYWDGREILIPFESEGYAALQEYFSRHELYRFSVGLLAYEFDPTQPWDFDRSIERRLRDRLR